MYHVCRYQFFSFATRCGKVKDLFTAKNVIHGCTRTTPALRQIQNAIKRLFNAQLLFGDVGSVRFDLERSFRHSLDIPRAT